MFRWETIRSHRGSQQSAFEEFCSQLARHEPGLPAGSTFIRKGTPDAGVECYWRKPLGKETAWQAKFFLQSLGDKQWEQCDSSVLAALRKHADLEHFILCLPIDLPDGRVEGTTTARQRWEARVAKWTKWASAKNMEVSFELWGNAELVERMSKEEHRGRMWFWFGGEGLTKDWMTRHHEEIVATLDRRYQPNLHVDVELQDAITAITRCQKVDARVSSLMDTIIAEWTRCPDYHLTKWSPNEFVAARESLAQLHQVVQTSRFTGTGHLVLSSLRTTIRQVIAATDALRDGVLDHLRETNKEHEKKDNDSKRKAAEDRSRHIWTMRCLDDFNAVLHDFLHYASRTLHFAEHPLMILIGEAGIGKSHLLAHGVEQHVTSGRPAVMLLGEHFNSTAEPWRQIISNLGLAAPNAETLLGGLQAAAEASGHRALVVIDALNEHGADVHRMWKHRLPGMVKKFSRYPGVAFIISIRSPMEQVILPRSLSTGPHVIHHMGFAGHEGDALASFLQSFKLPPPQSPLLLPEYSNPLFLVLYCETLKAREARGVPTALNGFAAVLDAWLDEAEVRSSERMGTDPEDRPLRQGIRALAREMLCSSNRILSRDRAKEVLGRVHRGTEYSRSLFRTLVAENIIVEVQTWRENEKAVRFQYERFQDFFIAAAIIDTMPSDSPAVGPKTVSSPTLDDIWNHPWHNAGVLQALSILLPARRGVELHDIAPVDAIESAESIVVGALPWRASHDIGPSATGLVRETLSSNELAERWRAIRSLLLLSSVPNHPLNARFLHGWLNPMTMPGRDVAWSSVLLYHHDDSHSSSQRLLDWSMARDDFDDLCDEARLLFGIALGWMLTSSHRPLRDHSTKALVHLFESRLDLLQAWMDLFWEVNDTYVLERMLAVAFGAVVRSEDGAGTKEVAIGVFERLFAGQSPPVHVLLRDYARNIVDLAHVSGLLPDDLDAALAHPPYTSPWPEELPSKEKLEAQFGERHSSVVYSMVGGGDFDCYEVGTNSWRPAWTPRRRGEAPPPTAEEVLREFEDTLDDAQVQAWGDYRKLSDQPGSLSRLRWVLHGLAELRNEGDDEGGGIPAHLGESAPMGDLYDKWKDIDLEELERRTQADVDTAHENLLSVLSEAQTDTLEGQVRQVIEGQYDYLSTSFPMDLAHRYLLNRVLELGWDESTLGELDRSWDRSYSGRTAHKAERLGKKYQWLALHSFQAAASDNFQFRGGLNDGDERATAYQGPWQLYSRDIDPTCLLGSTHAVRYDAHRTWWSPEPFDEGRADETDEQWLSAPRSLPDPRRMLEVQGPNAGSRWLVLDAIHNWKEAIPFGASGISLNQRTLWYWPRAYLVHSGHLEIVLQWARQQDFFGRWMPEVSEETPQLMLRERGWSRAWGHFNCYYHGRPGWDQGREDRGIPHPVKPTWDYYMAEGSTHDCSIDEGYTLHLPCPDLVEILGLHHASEDGYFLDASRSLAAFDPTISEAGPGALLLRADQLERLREQGYEVLWILLGEQRLREVGDGTPDEWLGGTQVSGAFVRRAEGWEGTLRLFPIKSGAFPKCIFKLDYSPGKDDPSATIEAGDEDEKQ